MKRLALITFILGTTLAIVPAANAVALLDGGGPSGSNAVVLHTDTLGGNGALSTAVAPDVRDGWMSSITPQASPVVLHTDVLGGNGGGSAIEVPAVGASDSFDWGSASIGAATLAGVMLLAVAFAAATRRRHQLGF